MITEVSETRTRKGSRRPLIQSRVQFPHRYAQKFRRPSLAEAKGYDMTRNY